MQTSTISITFSDVKELEFTTIDALTLNQSAIPIYTIYLPNFISIAPDLAQFLDKEELLKAERFHQEKDKNRFIITRAILKGILAVYTKLAVNKIEFAYQSNKKPFLSAYPLLHFNVSHSADYAVIAMSTSEVGIDIEHIAEDFNFSSILPEIFSENEIFDIKNASDLKHAFYTAWTRKEAFVKGIGIGIDEDFKNVPCSDGTHTIDSNVFKTDKNWTIASFELSPGYLCAVALANDAIVSKNIVLYSMPNSIEMIL